MEIKIDNEGHLCFIEDERVRVSLPIFTVEELEFDEEIDEIDYILADPTIYPELEEDIYDV